MLRKHAIMRLSTLIIITNSPVIATANSFGFGEPSEFTKSGCPVSSVKVTKVGSGSTVTTMDLTFSSYHLNGRGIRRCGFIIPIRVPRGRQISTLTVDWEGHRKKTAELSRRYGPSNLWFRNRLASIDSNKLIPFRLRDNIENLVRKPCGVSTKLWISSKIRTFKATGSISVAPQIKFQAIQPNSNALSPLSNQNRVRFQVQFKNCQAIAIIR